MLSRRKIDETMLHWCPFGRVPRVLYWSSVCFRWFTSWANPTRIYENSSDFMGFSLGFVNFLVGWQGHLRKLINVSNRARRVVCWSTLCFVWSTAWANRRGKYSSPDVRYPTYNSNNSKTLIIPIILKLWSFQ